MRKIDFAMTDYDCDEVDAVSGVLNTPNSWLASGPQNEAFEKEVSQYVGTKHGICVNSGSSANLLGILALGLPKGSRILTSACGFPATLSPIIHAGHTPVLVDYSLDTHNIDVEAVLRELPNVRAVILAHTLGNPVDIRRITEKARILGVYVIEDCCEAMGTLSGSAPVGRFGDIATFSFYPSHQITAGGAGGMVVTNDTDIAMECKSYRDWGKVWNWDEKLGDNKTFYDQQIEGLDYKYYRHYTYQTLGYNFKLGEMNCAFGREQLKKLNSFSMKRLTNYMYLRDKLRDLDDFIQPTITDDRISWFGYTFTVRDGSPINRNHFGEYLESVGIRHRPFFAGNILRHLPFRHLSGTFPVAEKLMKDSLFIGCHTKMTVEDLDYIVEKVRTYVASCHT